MKHLSKLMGASLLLIALSIPQSAIYAAPSLKVLGAFSTLASKLISYMLATCF
jgi:hypothetical protein